MGTVIENKTAVRRNRRVRLRVAVIGLVVLVAGALALYGLREKVGLGGAAGRSAQSGEDASYSTVKVERGSILVTVPASGKLEPSLTTTVRPDSNMPTRKLTRMLAREGDRVATGQALAEVDSSGLDLELESARATYESARIKLENLRAGATPQELASAEVNLRQADVTLSQALETYDSTKRLVDKGLSARDQLLDAQRQLDLARLRHDAARIQYEDTSDGTDAGALRSQEAAVAQAGNSLRKAELVSASVAIRAPTAGVVTDIAVKVGDLVSAGTAIMTIAETDPMLMTAMIDESDVRSLRPGQRAEIIVDSDPDHKVAGTVTALAVKAEVQSNITVFPTTIEIPNPAGTLLWGMNADAEIVITEATGVLLLPLGAVRRNGQETTVSLPDEGELVSWSVVTGPDDGSKIQILRGLDEGDEVAVVKRAAAQAPTQQGGLGGAGAMFRIAR